MDMHAISFRRLTLSVLLLSYANLSLAQKDNAQELMAQSTPVPVVTKIYSQVVFFTLPKGFAIQATKQEDGNYVQRYKLVAPVVAAEGLLEQEIALFGFRGIAKTENVIQVIGEAFKRGLKSQCVDTFVVDDVGKTKIATGQEAFVFMAGCGFRKPVENSEKNKKISMYVVIQGSNDIYVFQWMESSNSSAMPSLNWPVWRKRLEELMPFSLQ